MDLKEIRKQQRLKLLRSFLWSLLERGQSRNASLDAMKLSVQFLVREIQPEVDVDQDYESNLVRSMVYLLEPLKKVRFEGGDGDSDDQVCAICLNEISVGEFVTGLPCDHMYHHDCIVKWLQKSNTCPRCRFELPVL